MVRPIRNNRNIHAPRPERQDAPENMPLPIGEEQLDEQIQNVLGEQILRPEGQEGELLVGQEQFQQAPPRRRRRVVPDVLVESDSEDDLEQPFRPPLDQRQVGGILGRPVGAQLAQAPDELNEDEDELDRALKQRQANNGSWEKHILAFQAGEAVLCSTSIQALSDLPELFSNLPKIGGSGLEQHLSAFRNLWTSWDNVLKNMKFRGLGPKDLAKGEKVARASAQLFRRFLDTYSPISSAPGAIQGIISFFEEPVTRALLGAEKSNSITQQLRSFARAQRNIAAHSFSTLCRWKPKSQYRAQNQSSGRYHPYDGRSGRSGGYGGDQQGSSSSGGRSRSGGFREGGQGGKSSYDRSRKSRF